MVEGVVRSSFCDFSQNGLHKKKQIFFNFYQKQKPIFNQQSLFSSTTTLSTMSEPIDFIRWGSIEGLHHVRSHLEKERDKITGMGGLYINFRGVLLKDF